MKPFFSLSFIGCLLSLALPAPAASAAQPANGKGPRIQFNTEDYDFGKVVAGDPIRYTFVATNAGDQILDISAVRPSCGCTTVGSSSGGATTWTPQHVAPNETSLIPIQVATSNLKGTIAKTVTISSNDKTRPSVVVRLHGLVWTPIEVTPPAAYLTILPDAPTNSPVTLRIVNNMDEPLTLSAPASSTNLFSAELKTRVPAKEFDLIISTLPASRLPVFHGTSLVQGTISLKTSASNLPVLNITAMATIQPEVMVAPAQIMLPAGPLAQPMTNWVTLRGNTAKSFTLSEPGANVPGVQVAIRPMQPNRSYNLVVIFPRGFEVKPGQYTIVSVKSDNPRYPVINIPVFPRATAFQPFIRPGSSPAAPIASPSASRPTRSGPD